MSGVNKAIILGRLGKDPELSYMPNGDAVTNISMATSETWKDKQTGEKKEKTEWHRITLFRKQAEVASEYLHKGSQVYIEGKIQTRKWQDSNGQDRYTTEIIAEKMSFVDKKDNIFQPQEQHHQPAQQAQPAADDFDDQIPF